VRISFSLPQKIVPAKILVVEDEIAARFLLSHFLQEKGFEVLEAGTAQEAMAFLTAHPEIALVFTDVRLPGMNGHALVQWVRERHPSMPIIVGSGSALASALAHGANYSFFVKPYNFEEIGNHIHALLANRAATQAAGRVVSP
jgi:DNA-binding NtrC family response regulator